MQKSTTTGLVTRPLDVLGVSSLVLCCAIWGVNQVAMKVANDGIPPLLQAGIRSVLAGLLVIVWAKTRGVTILALDGTLLAGIATGVLFGLNFMCIGPGLSLTEASRGVLFLYSAPFFTAIGAHVLIPGDRLNLVKALGLVLAFSGLVVSVSDRLQGGGAGGDAGAGGQMALVGDLLCLAAGLFWALTTLVVRISNLARAAPERTLLAQLVFSAPLLFGASALVGEMPKVPLDAQILGWFAYTVVIVVVFSYALWFWLLQRYPASEVSAFTFLGPVFAVGAGHVLLGEPVTWRHGAALALIAIGLVLVTRPARAPFRRA